MILDSIMGFLFAILEAILGLLPAWSLPLDLAAVGSSFGSGVATANAFFPVTVLGGCLLAVFGLVAVLAVWRLVVWVYDKVPFKFT